MQGIDTTLVPIPLSSSNSRAFKAIETSDPVAINITRRFFDASSKIYAPLDTKFANWCFCLTVGRFCLDNAKTDGVFFIDKAISQHSAVSIVSAGLNTNVFGVERDIARCSTG